MSVRASSKEWFLQAWDDDQRTGFRKIATWKTSEQLPPWTIAMSSIFWMYSTISWMQSPSLRPKIIVVKDPQRSRLHRHQISDVEPLRGGARTCSINLSVPVRNISSSPGGPAFNHWVPFVPSAASPFVTHVLLWLHGSCRFYRLPTPILLHLPNATALPWFLRKCWRKAGWSKRTWRNDKKMFIFSELHDGCINSK